MANLLNVITLIQDKKKLSVSESVAGLNTDWYASTKSYFFNLPDELLAECKLVKNNYCFEALQRFSVTNKINNSENTDLKKFEFSF